VVAGASLALLGGFEARLDTGVSLALPTHKYKALLAFLAVPAGQVHPRDKLVALLWGDLSREQGRTALRQAVWSLRRALNSTRPAALVLEGDTIGLNAEAVSVDVADFERAAISHDPVELARAAALYRGEFLAGIAGRETPFEEWLVVQRERLAELAVEALARLLRLEWKAGNMEAAVQTALRLLAVDPLQEPVHRALMQLYVQLGRRAAALRQYQTCASVLQRELGVEPETETKELYQYVLRVRPAPALDQPAMLGPTAPPAGGVLVRSGLSAADAPLIGRQSEMARLRALLDGARRGRGGAVVIEGEAGIGKSRLLDELMVEASRSGMRTLLGRCYESEQILPFGPWADALRSGGVLQERGALRGLEPVWRAELARLLPELAGSALPTPSDDARRLFESLTRLLEATAAMTPLVLALEDVHWADEMTLRLLAFVGRRIAAQPLLVGLTARQEEVADAPALRRTLDELQDEERLARLPLTPLARADTVALMQALIGPGREAADLARLGAHVWALSQGNPFVVAEAVRAVAERGTTDPLPLAVPDRVRAVISRRLEHVGAKGRELAAVGAVIGREFTFALLRQAAGVSEPEAAEAVEELVRRQVLQHLGDRFDFMHDRVREVVYGELLLPRRVLLHRAVAEAIETLHADHRETHGLALGLHYLRGQVWDKAVAYLGQAGAKAIERSAYREAAECLEQALGALRHLPTDRQHMTQAIDLRLDLARPALYQLGHVKRAAAVLREAEALARALGDDRRLGRVTAHLIFCLRSMGEKSQAIEAGQQALRIATRLTDLDIEVPTNISLGQVFHDKGDYPRAVALFRRNIEVLIGELALHPFRGGAPRSIHSRTCLATSLAELGEFDEATTWADEALRAAQGLERPPSLVVASAGLGHVLLRRGDWPRAVAILEPALTIARMADVALWFPRIASTLGAVYLLAGRPTAGRGLLEEALERTIARELMHQRALILVWLGEAALAVGRLADAEQIAEQALDLSRDNDERGHGAWALRLLGEIGSRSVPPDSEKSADSYRQGLTVATTLGMRPLVAHCLLGLGTLGPRVTPSQQDRAHLDAAIAMFREMGMAFWLAKAEGVLNR
jgi:DNA-binding SARP family transcriptional activator